MSQHDNPAAEPAIPAPQLISPQDGVRRMIARGALLIDVRRLERRVENGVIADAVIVSRTAVQQAFAPTSPQNLVGAEGLDREIVVFCSSENGSRPVVEKLAEFGYRNVFHIDGGFAAWKSAGLPFEKVQDINA